VRNVIWVAFLVQGLNWLQVEARKGAKRLEKGKKGFRQHDLAFTNQIFSSKC
jgi:hypothetical protein